MAHYEYLIFASGRRHVEHGGVTSGRLVANLMTVPVPPVHAATEGAPSTLCAISTSGLAAFADQVFENVPIDMRCPTCWIEYDALG